MHYGIGWVTRWVASKDVSDFSRKTEEHITFQNLTLLEPPLPIVPSL